MLIAESPMALTVLDSCSFIEDTNEIPNVCTSDKTSSKSLSICPGALILWFSSSPISVRFIVVFIRNVSKSAL